LKLLYITNGITGAGGLERVLSVKASMLAEDFGYNVHILSLNEKGKVSFFEFSPKVYRHSFSVAGSVFQYAKSYTKGIQQKIKEIQPDIISVCDDALKGFFLPIVIRSDAKWIYESHASILLSNQGYGVSLHQRFQHLLKQFLGRRFSKIVLLTDRNRKEWTLPQLEVIPNPLPFQTENVSTLQNKQVIAVGSYSYNKGYDLLLKIWAQIERGFPDWELNVYGRSTYENLSEEAERMNLSSVHFFPPDPDIQEKYKESSVFVLPSRSEGFGMVLIEAMSCGLPVVSFDCPHGPGDIITDGQDGYLIENGHIEAFADKLSQLMQNPDLRQKMGNEARETSKKYLPEKIASQWDRLFKFLLS